MNARVFGFCLIFIFTSLTTSAQTPAPSASPSPNIYQTLVRDAVKTNASWKPVESRGFGLRSMTSDGKRLLAARRYENTVYAFDLEQKTWTDVGRATWVISFAYAKGKLWAATFDSAFVTIASPDLAVIEDFNLWTCDPVLGKVSFLPGSKASDDLYRCWKQVGKAPGVEAMTSDGERLWYADSLGTLWVRPATEDAAIPWKAVDNAKDITAMTFGADTLWATNTSNQLLVRDPVLGRIGWKVIGEANEVTGLAFLDGKLWSLTRSVKSVYSQLDIGSCGPVRTKSEISSEWTCAGIQGYKLTVHSDDDRDSATVITPDGKQYPLDFSKTISKGAFASLGQKAEWRVLNKDGKDVPIALIIRVDVEAADSKKRTSYLAVSKITGQRICVTDRIEGVRADERVLEVADASASKPCL